MTVTPSSLFALAVSRHRQPWNWCLHVAALVLFCLALLAHGYLLLAVSLILLGAGFFELKLPDLPDNRWFRLARRGVEWEKNWSAAPWNRVKWTRLLFFFALAGLTVWALWVRELATLMLLIGFAVLVRVMRENRKSGIDP
ncbi:hypothetical protein LF599_16395 [Pseudodesulfovibrio thermohalotolerans]|uniref:hypothetical protein n=1 Tax=Pseudodesulfovibrio thermohalotolerans TaxID=2880651 RepID=UPI002442BB35|nr:hypothetical protein [Pseudodesulfovibrio thermohalotolerans]WFS62220.1 hypothetical protein LF599_16395 [Pseudodesulfovibrio thermohalotolerans]